MKRLAQILALSVAAFIGSLPRPARAIDASISVGPVLVHSSRLGYESPYLGATVRGDVAKGMFALRAEASYLWAKKRETGDGNGQSAIALAGVRWRAIDVMAGASYSRQETSAWEKDQVRRIAEIGWSNNLFRTAVTYSGNDAPEQSESLGLRIEGGNRLRLVFAYEHIRYVSYFGERGDGDKVVVAGLWRLH